MHNVDSTTLSSAINNYTGIGGRAAIPTIRIENTFNPVVNFTETLGRHTLKWDASLVRRQITDFQDLGEQLIRF